MPVSGKLKPIFPKAREIFVPPKTEYSHTKPNHIQDWEYRIIFRTDFRKHESRKHFFRNHTKPDILFRKIECAPTGRTEKTKNQHSRAKTEGYFPSKNRTGISIDSAFSGSPEGLLFSRISIPVSVSGRSNSRDVSNGTKSSVIHSPSA